VAAAVAAAELEAREGERQRWAALVEREREAGERRIAEVRASGRAQHAELLRSLEGRLAAELDAELAAVAARAAADAAEARAQEARLVGVRAELEAARREKLELEAAASRARSAATVVRGVGARRAERAARGRAQGVAREAHAPL